jgi:dihydroxyacid dehydratase/phosphogluconate dehydratase
MLRAIGFQDKDFLKPLMGLTGAGAEVSSCNVHHDELAAAAEEALIRSGGVPGTPMPMAGLNLPGIFVYGGAIQRGGRSPTRFLRTCQPV